MGGSRFKGKVNEFGFRHFELQVVLWDNQQEVGNFGLEPREFRTRKSHDHVNIFSFYFCEYLFNP